MTLNVYHVGFILLLVLFMLDIRDQLEEQFDNNANEPSAKQPFVQNKIYEMVEEFRKRRDVMINGLNSLPGISCFNPKGAFYAFPNIRDTGYSSQQFTELVLDKAGVAVTPGPIFGINGEGFVRLCYVNSVENIEKAIENIRKVLT